MFQDGRPLETRDHVPGPGPTGPTAPCLTVSTAPHTPGSDTALTTPAC